jgi:hypothetical protein
MRLDGIKLGRTGGSTTMIDMPIIDVDKNGNRFTNEQLGQIPISYLSKFNILYI